jgi:hypothetical protein
MRVQNRNGNTNIRLREAKHEKSLMRYVVSAPHDDDDDDDDDGDNDDEYLCVCVRIM